MLLALGLSSCAANAQKTVQTADRYARSITAQDLQKHLTIISGPEMEGRETATAGEKRAAQYLINQLRALGVEPANNGEFLMPFPVFRDSVTNARFVINGKTFEAGKDFRPYLNNFTSHLRFGEVQFVNPEDSAYKNNEVPLSGRLVMLNEPPRQRGRRGPNPVFDLLNKGASGILLVSDEPEADASWRLAGMTNNQFPSRNLVNTWVISREMANAIAGNATLASSESYKANVEIQYDEASNELVANNVAGIIRGSKFPDEYIVVSAHYDHTGRRGEVINYGADDDGSGTVALLELAEAFMQAKNRNQGPDRSIVFLWVSGEEKGLWGSYYYSENPIFPLEKTTANLNIDMIGRVDTIYGQKTDSANYVYIIGDNRLSSQLNPITQQANARVKLTLDQKYNAPDDPERIYFRSDHYHFARKGVPAIFYFNGIHADYHRPTDTVDKINFPLHAKRTQLVFYTAWLMANREGLLPRDTPLNP